MIPLSGAAATDTLGSRPPVAISTTHVAYSAGPRQQLYVRALSSADGTPVAERDGRGAAVLFTRRRVARIRVLGRRPAQEAVRRRRSDQRHLTPLADLRGASWGTDGTILFSDFEKGIMRVSSAERHAVAVAGQSGRKARRRTIMAA